MLIIKLKKIKITEVSCNFQDDFQAHRKLPEVKNHRKSCFQGQLFRNETVICSAVEMQNPIGENKLSHTF